MKNSWILTLLSEDKHIHNYFCRCSNKFKIQTNANKKEAPDVLCSKCGNDYFIDAIEWESGASTKIWKQFFWEKSENIINDTWNIELYFQIPRYSDADSAIVLERQKLIGASLANKADTSIQFKYSYPVIAKYSLYTEERVQELKKLLIQDAKEYLYQNLIENKPSTIDWINEVDLKEFNIDVKFNCLIYFLTHSHLKEMDMFHWKMPILQENTVQYPTQQKMLDYIIEHKPEKAIKKALYRTYKDALDIRGYYPYSDFVFSRSIDDTNFLVQLLSLYPAVKQHIFTDETFTYATQFIKFLKLHYSEKQISKLFIVEMQNDKTKRSSLINWRDTLRLIQVPDSFEYLDQYFQKVKLTTKLQHRMLNNLCVNDELLAFIAKNIDYLDIDTINLSESDFQESSEIVEKLGLALDMKSWIEDKDKLENGCVKLFKYEENE